MVGLLACQKHVELGGGGGVVFAQVYAARIAMVQEAVLCMAVREDVLQDVDSELCWE